MKFDSKLTFEEHVLGILSCVSQRIGILRLVKHIFVDTSMLVHCYHAFVLTILEYSSPVWGQLLNVIFSFSSASVFGGSDQTLFHCVIDVMLPG